MTKDTCAQNIIRNVQARNVREGIPKHLRVVINGLAIIVILGLVAFVTLLAIRPLPCGSRVQTAKIDISAIRTAALLYRVQFPTDCPNMKRLIEVGFIEQRVGTTDPWDREYIVKCDEDAVTVTSAGPDGLPDTDDDVR